jgi:hypothetical protein
MVYRGHVKNGMVVLDEGADLPEGAEVQVALIAEASHESSPGESLTLYERLAPFIGKAEGLPADFSINHDHYLYGAPKRQ